MSDKYFDSPIFIIGSPRSGTTLLRLMLTCHPKIVIPTECGFLVHLYEKYKDFDGSSEDIISFVSDTFNAKKFELWRLLKEEMLAYLLAKCPKNYRELSSGIYEYYGKINQPKAIRWGDKNNYYLKHIDCLNKIFPEAQYVHIIRDGRDVACSYKDMLEYKDYKYGPKCPERIDEIAKQWRNNIQTIRENFGCVGWNKVLEVKYEELVSNPRLVLKKTSRFLGLEYSEKMLDYHVENTNKKLVPKEIEAWKKMNREKVTKSRIARWRSELTSNEVTTFNQIARSILEEYHYI